MPLVGIEEATIDDKNRVLVSKKKRERLGDSFVIGIGILRCAVLYPQSTFNAILKEAYDGTVINHDREDYIRLLTKNIEDEVGFDGQGRFVMPPKIKSACELPSKVLMVGAIDRVEIWDPVRYEKWEAEQKEFESERREKFARSYLSMTGHIR